ncbi:MAG TPA: YHYH protein [Reyranella sp.]|nr:YHYH protein [Reyranella sp.]
MIAALLLLGAPALAHGGHDEDKLPGADQQQVWWLDLVPRAAAAETIEIDEKLGFRYIRADGLPNHATGQFPNRDNPNRISAQSYSFQVALHPLKAGQAYYYPPNTLFGVAVNGVVFDPQTAEFWHNDRRWMIEALSGARPLGIDQNNAHVQPGGAYHYHGVPTGLVATLGSARPALVGWAADGFPIYVDEKARPGWHLKKARDAGGPGGAPDGTFARDFQYVPGTGDLDECNGRDGKTAEFPQGTYYYVITAQFPYVPRCFVGTISRTFVKQGPPPGMGPPGGRPPPPGMGPPPR